MNHILIPHYHYALNKAHNDSDINQTYKCKYKLFTIPNYTIINNYFFDLTHFLST